MIEIIAYSAGQNNFQCSKRNKPDNIVNKTVRLPVKIIASSRCLFVSLKSNNFCQVQICLKESNQESLVSTTPIFKRYLSANIMIGTTT